MKPITKQERIICATWEYFNINSGLVSYVPVPINRLPTDIFNEILANTCVSAGRLMFLTSHGRVVNDKVALTIALQAGQYDNEGKSKILIASDFFKSDIGL